MFRFFFLLVVITGATALNDYWYALYGCHPPSSLRARAELTGFDNDRDFNGAVTNEDIDKDVIAYDYNGDTTRTYEWETVFHWRCRYGWSEDYGGYFHNLLDQNNDGVWTAADFGRPFSVTGELFRKMQIDRFRKYCADRNNKPQDCWKLQSESNLDNFGNFSLPMNYYF
ncbi:hypothetical protein SNE40_012940 [Patella caerulea]|uniref:Uncharacterized protein n=1 Tax=Patella caerulea TaxID=87958 RepID=A0AAN8JH38_PATCE